MEYDYRYEMEKDIRNYIEENKEVGDTNGC